MLNKLKAYGIAAIGWERIKLRGFDGHVERVCADRKVSRDAIFRRGVRGTAAIAAARADLCVAFRDEGCSLPEIGRLLEIDHTSALYHLRKRDGRPLITKKDRETLSYPKEPLL